MGAVTKPSPKSRAMVRSELLGSHSHSTSAGVSVHVYTRGGKFLARGRSGGRQFGYTLGSSAPEAVAALRRLLVELDDGTFVPPSERPKRPLAAARPCRHTLRQLLDEFLAEKQSTRGRQTCATYRSRLAPVLAFAERPEALKRWPRAADADRAFAVALRVHLFAATVTANGRPGAARRTMSARQVHNVLDCLRSALNWAARPQVGLLPAGHANPFCGEIVGKPPAADPLRPDKLPLDVRAALVAHMDCWHLAGLGLALVLPLRPEELAGLLVDDVDMKERVLRIGTRFGGGDFTKGRQSFVLPLPDELMPLVEACVHLGWPARPLLCPRRVWEGLRLRKVLALNVADLQEEFEKALAREKPGRVQTEQDRKRVFRSLLLQVGGVDPDELAREFKALARRAGLPGDVHLYHLRHAVTTDMNRAGVPHLELRYLTSHATTDILNHYVELDPHDAMRRYGAYATSLIKALVRRGRELDCLPDGDDEARDDGPAAVVAA